MAKGAKLKVYVTPIGFHDAYVAAPSQKAALKAWGTATDLFGAGRATLVEEGGARDEALATPGLVVRRLRGSEAAMLDFEAPGPGEARPAAGSRKEPAAAPAKPGTRPRPVLPPKAKPKPPDRSRLDAAEAALAGARRDLADELARIESERQALNEREAALKEAAAGALRDIEGERDAARRAFEAAGGRG